MTKVYGASDDLVVIENGNGGCEIDCFGKDVRICFEDGTIIRVGYPKSAPSVWWIEIEKRGYAEHVLTPCSDEDGEVYSDVFEIKADVQEYFVMKQKYGGCHENN